MIPNPTKFPSAAGDRQVVDVAAEVASAVYGFKFAPAPVPGHKASITEAESQVVTARGQGRHYFVRRVSNLRFDEAERNLDWLYGLSI